MKHTADTSGVLAASISMTAGFLALSVLMGCGPASAPSAPPSPVTSPTAPIPPPRKTPMLVVEQQSATVTGPDAEGYFYYHPRFLLRETTGNEGAAIQNVWPISPDGPDEGYSYGPVCFQKTLRVPPGEILDIFFTDAGLNSLGCSPKTWAKTEAGVLDLVVTFQDDDGRPGEVKASVPVRH